MPILMTTQDRWGMSMRSVHLVGSLPPAVTEAGGPRAGLAWLREIAGARADLFDSWACDRDDRWIIRYLDQLDERPQLRQIRAGKSDGYDRMPLYRWRRGATRTPEAVVGTEAVEYAAELSAAYGETFQDEATAPRQISRPNPLDLALFVFCGRPQFIRHPLRTATGAYFALRYLTLFEDAAKLELARITDGSGHRIAWQLETPAVLFALNLVPGPIRPALAKLLAKQVARVLAGYPRGQDVTYLHLCYGDLENHEVLAPRSTKPVVLFLNALSAELRRRDCPLPTVHVPLAYGAEPPPQEAAYYRPLAKLDARWEVAAGVVDETRPEESRTGLALFEEHAKRPARSVAAACGLGRHSVADARRAVELCLEIATAPS